VTPEALRRGALDALGPHADERALDVMRRATILLERSVRRWIASAGDVEAHRVTLAVDAGTLGLVRAAPAVADALCRAIAVAIARRPGETLLELVLRWSPRADAPDARRDPYRDASRSATEIALGDALVAYLEESGQAALAALFARDRANVTNGAPIVVHLSAPAYEELRGVSGGIETVVRALRDLAGDKKAKVRFARDKKSAATVAANTSTPGHHVRGR
jgi:hypothetical protein